MRAAKIKEHPGFLLMKQTDVQSIYYMQMPRWLFSDPRYADMNLDAKVTYTFLLNRFQLSRRKGWVNDQGEVFVIFPRLALAGRTAHLREKGHRWRSAALAERELIWRNAAAVETPIKSIWPRWSPRTIPAYSALLSLQKVGRTAVPEQRIRRF